MRIGMSRIGANRSVLLAMLLLAGIQGAVIADDESDAVARQREAQLQLIAEALTTLDVHVAHCQIPTSAQLSVAADGTVAEAQTNFTKVTVALSLSRIAVKEIVRGEIDSMIFVRSMPQLTEGEYLPIFTNLPGSEWLLFLESPMNTKHPEHTFLMNRYEETDANTFLSRTNFFTVRSHGCAALCVKWPDSATYRPPIVATSDFVSDVKLIISWLETPEHQLDLGSMRALLKDGYGEQLLERVVGRQ